MGPIARGKIKHSYPHSWRSKAPVIYRNTLQWFASIDRAVGDNKDEFGSTIRERLNSIDKLVSWTPQTGRNRLYSMIEHVLIGFYRDNELGGALNLLYEKGASPTDKDFLLKNDAVDRIAKAFESEGADAWYLENAKERFLEGT